MDCPSPPFPTNVEFMQAFNRRVFEGHVPFSGSIELTRRCNLRCVHCYCGERNRTLPPSAADRPELSTEEACAFLGQAANQGCLFLLITGGEPLLRPDFETIYRHAKSLGFLITVFSNGTLVHDRFIDLFRELQPRYIEITLYGATEATYARVTGSADAYRQCREGIERLLAAGVRVKLKTILMTVNRHELVAMEALADHYGAPFRFDAAITGRVCGDTTPINLRISAEDSAEIEFSRPKFVKGWQEWLERAPRVTDDKRVYNCGAGSIAFHIDADGILRACPSNTMFGYDLRTLAFSEAWAQLGQAVAGARAPKALECNRCENRTLCTWCPPFAELEGLDTGSPVRYLCAVAEARQRKLAVIAAGGG